MHTFFASNVRHYEMAGDHFAKTEGYQRYAAARPEVMPGVRELKG